MFSAFEMLVSAKEAKLIASGLKIMLSHLGQRYSLQSFISSSNKFPLYALQAQILVQRKYMCEFLRAVQRMELCNQSPTSRILTGQQCVKLKAAKKQWII
jgi:hypothetical protein